MRKGTSWIAVLIVIVLGSGLGVLGGTFLAKWLPIIQMNGGGIADLVRNPFGGEKYVRILMIGEDDTSKRNSNGNGLSDTLVVFAIDTETKEIRAISIPRDTRVEIPDHGTCKINSANVYGGPELCRSVVSSLVGVPIDYYVKTNTTGLRGMVDLVGGVYIVVDKDMNYDDRRGNLHIHLKASPEKQLLKGRDAEGYVRFRHDAIGDYGWREKDGKRVASGRIVRQQLFMRALANRILAMPTRRERAEFLKTASDKKFIVTNLKLRDWEGLADYLKDIKPESIAMDVMPGSPQHIGNGSYVVADEEALRRVVSRNLLFQDIPTDATVEVLNGSGSPGLARKVADKLAEAGYKVTRTGNAPTSDYNASCIINHRRKAESAEYMVQLLRCGEVRQESADDSAPDITVIIGRDYTE